jgi:hypothetical protein
MGSRLEAVVPVSQAALAGFAVDLVQDDKKGFAELPQREIKLFLGRRQLPFPIEDKDNDIGFPGRFPGSLRDRLGQ